MTRWAPNGVRRPAAGQRRFALGPCQGVPIWFAALLASVFAAAEELPSLDGAAFSPPRSVQATAREGVYRLTVELSPAAGRVCDDLSLRLRIHHPKDAVVQEVLLGGQAETFVVRENQDLPPQPEGDAFLSERQYVLEPLQAGRIAIGPVEVTLTRSVPGGPAQTVIHTEPLSVELQTVVALPPRLEALRPPAVPPAAVAPQAWRLPWPWAGAVGAALLVLAGLVWRWAGKHAAGRMPSSPQAEARRRLAELVADGRTRKDVKAFYVALADIVRQYLAQAARVPAMEQTSEECLATVAQRAVFSPEAAETLARFFNVADRVKFARWEPQPAQIDESFRQVQSLIEAPVLRPEPGPGAALPAQHVEAAR